MQDLNGNDEVFGGAVLPLSGDCPLKPLPSKFLFFGVGTQSVVSQEIRKTNRRRRITVQHDNTSSDT